MAALVTCYTAGAVKIFCLLWNSIFEQLQSKSKSHQKSRKQYCIQPCSTNDQGSEDAHRWQSVCFQARFLPQLKSVRFRFLGIWRFLRIRFRSRKRLLHACPKYDTIWYGLKNDTILFLDASTHLYKRVCPSVCQSVGLLVGPSVGPLVSP